MERSSEDLQIFRGLVRNAAKEIVDSADAVFTTSAGALQDLVKGFTTISDASVIEEAGNATEGETVNTYLGDHKKLVMAGDPAQLP